MKRLNISAGGKSSRMRLSGGKSKHLLQIPGVGESILGQIVNKARSYFGHIVIWGGDNTSELEKSFPGLVTRDVHMTGPLGPMLRELLETNQRSYGCAGDFICDFSWAQFEEFHNNHNLPVSILIARSVPVNGAARFITNDVQILTWERVEKSIPTDLINIGAYIIDPDDRIVRAIEQLKGEDGSHSHKEDPFFSKMTNLGLLGGYNPNVIGYNVNTQEAYAAAGLSVLTGKEEI